MTRRILSALLAGLGVGAGCLLFVGWQLSRPVPAEIGPPPRDLDAETITFQSESGSLIHGWLSRRENGRGAVLLLPGVRENRLSMVDRARAVHAAGYSTLLIDFQATGESLGDAITFGWRERLDVRAAVQTLRRTLPAQPIGIIGTSLGGAATLLAAPGLNIQAAVLEAVYPSIDVAVEIRLRMRIGSLGAALTPLLLVQLRPRLGISPDDLRPVDHIAQLGCPVLIIAGRLDQHTTMDDTRRLFAAAREPKDLWVISDAAHVDYFRAGRGYQRRVLEFLEGAFKIGAPKGL